MQYAINVIKNWDLKYVFPFKLLAEPARIDRIIIMFTLTMCALMYAKIYFFMFWANMFHSLTFSVYKTYELGKILLKIDVH